MSAKLAEAKYANTPMITHLVNVNVIVCNQLIKSIVLAIPLDLLPILHTVCVLV